MILSRIIRNYKNERHEKQAIIVGANELKEINCCSGNLCLIQVQTKENDNIDSNKLRYSKKIMIECEMSGCPHKFHEVCRMRFYHGTKNKNQLSNKENKCC